jgi:hypothetical protein
VLKVVSYLLSQLTGAGGGGDDDDAGALGVAHAVAGECLGIGELAVDLVNGRLRIRHLSSPFGLFVSSWP